VAPRIAIAGAMLGAIGTTGCDGVFGVDFDDARPQSTGGGGSSGAGPGGSAGSGGTADVGHPWTKLELLNGDDGVPHATTDFVNAIWCGALDRCVVATEGDAFEAGNLYAATHEEVTEILFDGSSVVSDLAFIGLSPVGDGLVARVNRAEPLVLSTADYMSPAGWNAVDPGDLGQFEGTFNSQMWLQVSGGSSQLALSNVVMKASTPPGAGTVWTRTWQPPSVPNNFYVLKNADPMLCTVGPDIGRGPAGWVSDDLQVVAFPVGNGLYDDYPGACVSVDGAKTFRYAPLPAGEVTHGGPRGLRCNDAEHCWVFGDGSVNQPAYIYYSIGALGDGLTWKRASIAEGAERKLRDIAFAPDGLHGFAVGTEAPGNGLVIATDDGGETWSDNLVADIAAFEGAALLSVFALDPHNIWVGGERGLVMSNGRAGQP
jgi:hypothetical protein